MRQEVENTQHQGNFRKVGEFAGKAGRQGTRGDAVCGKIARGGDLQLESIMMGERQLGAGKVIGNRS
eukprot:174515-Rhodomonas_salina.2